MMINFDMEQWQSDLNVFRNCFYEGSYELFVRYITGLLVSENKTIDGLNSVFVQKTDQSNVNRLLTEYPWLKADFSDELKRLFSSHRIASSFSYFILDDTLLKKVGKHIQSAGVHFDHTKNAYIYGHQIVTSGYVFQSGFYPFLLELYTKEKQCEIENLVFKTKVEIAIEILEKAIAFHKPSLVLIDSWYCTQEIIRFLEENGIQYIIATKSNRLFTYRNKTRKISEFTGKLQNITSFCKDEYQYQVKSILAHFEDFGEKRLVFMRRRKRGTKEYEDWNTLITNILDVKDETLILFYSNRFSIEGFHKEAKQYLGLGKSQLRKRRGVVKHLHLVAVAYCLLKCAAWLKKGWRNLSFAERVRNVKDYFERNTLIKIIRENKRNILGAVTELFAHNRKS
jgi:SRSO17 transposase